VQSQEVHPKKKSGSPMAFGSAKSLFKKYGMAVDKEEFEQAIIKSILESQDERQKAMV